MRLLANSLLVLALLAAAAPAASPAWAQQEPPARVGRVAVVNGELGFHGTGETAWSTPTDGIRPTLDKSGRGWRIGATTLLTITIATRWA